jgi:hypothetical protein
MAHTARLHTTVAGTFQPEARCEGRRLMAKHDDLDPCCPRCGSSVGWQSCDECGGTGYSHHDCGEDVCVCLHPEDNVPCDCCDGRGGWWQCFAKAEWCQANPLPGRKNIPRAY